jgi:hypothetical protein
MSATDQEMDMELAQLQLEIFAEAVEVYRQNNEALPDSLGQLAESGYVKAPIAKDPWKGDYQYGKTEKGFRIVSAGPDGAFGTPDDLELERE